MTTKAFERLSRRLLACTVAALTALSALAALPSAARAGGYDIPLVNTARYGGQGGTGIAFVDGGTSLYLNPAGLGRVSVANVDVSATILAGQAQGTPTFLSPDVNVKSERKPLVFPFVSGAYRLTDFMTIGVAAYIVGGAGGDYVYAPNPNAEEIEDRTELVFQESTLGIAFNIDKIGLHIGAGYRITYGRLVRTRPDALTTLDLKLRGVNFEGFRVGLQWQFNEHVAFGAVYRNKIVVRASENGGSALRNDFDYVATDLILPARTGAGFRFDWGAFGTAVEFEWLFNSQNGTIVLDTEPALSVELQNVFDWSDQYILRWGGEYGFFDDQWPVRLGFVFGSATTSANFPNAFGPPPSPEYVLTVGTGYNHGDRWQISFAYARAWASKFVEVDTSDFFMECPNCGGPGQYALRANHFIFDFSYNWR
ncbi:MAG: outer membrane protein transport protein [Myxococcota bacterium]